MFTALFRNAAVLTVVGTLTDGSTLSRLVNLDGISDGPGGVADFQTAVFDAVFASTLFTQVAISGTAANGRAGAFQLDYLVLNSAVPEPVGWTTMMLGFGLAGAALHSRRRTAVSFS